MLVGTRLVQLVQRQMVLANIQRESQQNLYAVTRDVRNAQKILSVSSDTLVLGAFNMRLGFDTGPTGAGSSIFTVANIGTITYKYVAKDGGYISRTDDFNGLKREQKLMRNLLTTPSDVDYIFAPVGGAGPPYDSVEVVFRCGRGFFQKAPRVYGSEAMVRSRD